MMTMNEMISEERTWTFNEEPVPHVLVERKYYQNDLINRRYM